RAEPKSAPSRAHSPARSERPHRACRASSPSSPASRSRRGSASCPRADTPRTPGSPATPAPPRLPPLLAPAAPSSLPPDAPPTAVPTSASPYNPIFPIPAGVNGGVRRRSNVWGMGRSVPLTHHSLLITKQPLVDRRDLLRRHLRAAVIGEEAVDLLLDVREL